MTQPQVDSLVIRIDIPEAVHIGKSSFRLLRNIVNLAFQQRRKTLRNSLKSLNAKSLQQAFEKSDIDPQRRPETLTPDEFLRLTSCYSQMDNSIE